MSSRLTAEAGAREALWATVALLLSLWIGKHIAVGAAAPYIFTGIAALQLYLPLWLIQRAGEMPESHRIHVHGSLLAPLAVLRRSLVRARRRRGRAAWLPLVPPAADGSLPRLRRRRRAGLELLATYARGAVWRPRHLLLDLRNVVVVSAVVFPFFALAHHGWQELLGHHHRAFRLPPDLLVFWATNTFLIALPEELFYRGFLETRLERWWPTTTTVLGIPLGRTVFVASALFALGHFLGEYNPARLGPFLPAFLFSALARRSGSITGAVVFHGLCNTVSHLLAAGYVAR
ncbi:MAG TPA: CPBP family intramembrane glutamic endopeptidase [Myxococcota bacterium]